MDMISNNQNQPLNNQETHESEKENGQNKQNQENSIELDTDIEVVADKSKFQKSINL
jgi:hypothetical protein